MQKETSLVVQGMTCPSCIRHVKGALKGVAGVREVQVQLEDGKVSVKHDEDTEIAAMCSALGDAGYETTPAL